MPKRGRKKATKEPLLKPPPASDVHSEEKEGLSFEEKQRAFNEQEVECRIAAIQAITNAETQNLSSRLRILRSHFDSEQLQKPVLQFFRESLPNLSVVKNEKYQLYELEWNDRYIDAPMNSSMVENTTFLPTTGGLQMSTRSAKENILRAASLQIPTFALDDPSESLFQGLCDPLQTPGVDGHRLSVGMTPQTLRLPKHGEMLLSVRGSPLGLYKEENLEAIQESEDGSHGNTN